jgi:hypothetical protein
MILVIGHIPIVSSEEYSGRVLSVKKLVLLANKTTANMVVERESSSPGGESGKTHVWFIIFDHVSNIQEHFTDNNNVRENKDIDFINRFSIHYKFE